MSSYFSFAALCRHYVDKYQLWLWCCFYSSVFYMEVRFAKMVWVLSNSQSRWLKYFQNCFSLQIASLPTLEDSDFSVILKLHNISLHQLLYDALLTEQIVKIPRLLCSLHHYANMYFNPTPIQSFWMSSGTDPFASITEWVQSEGQTVQHQYEECGLHLKQNTEWMVVPEMLSFEIALSAQMTIDPHIFILVNGNPHLYQLHGVIYFGGQHFVAHLIEQNGMV